MSSLRTPATVKFHSFLGPSGLELPTLSSNAPPDETDVFSLSFAEHNRSRELRSIVNAPQMLFELDLNPY
jgi:hypothetical protein